MFRGSKFPSLYGKCIIGDYCDVSIWALTYCYDGVGAPVSDVRRLTSTEYREAADGLTSFGIDGNGELRCPSARWE